MPGSGSEEPKEVHRVLYLQVAPSKGALVSRQVINGLKGSINALLSIAI